MTRPGLVFDVGGTWFRSALWRPGGRLGPIRRRPSPARASHPDLSGAKLQELLLREILETARASGPIAWLSAALAGPVSPAGVVQRAPSLWGPLSRPFPLRARLAGGLRLPCFVMNDVAAAAVFYARLPRHRRFPRLAVATVSSGIGIKVLDRRSGEIFLSRAGYGGEIGHLPVDPSKDAPLCPCGARGHLNAWSSGPGAEALMRRRAAEGRAAFRRSLLHDRSGGDPARLTAPDLAWASRRRDPFALGILQAAAAPLARVLGELTLALGLEKIVIMGGFALGAGEPYRRALAKNLKRTGIYGRSGKGIDSLLTLAEAKDHPGLRGAGLWAEQRIKN